MGKWLKAGFFVAVLIGVGYLFGMVCRQLDRAYGMMLSPPYWDLLRLLLQVLLVLGAALVSAGVVAGLLRPVWLGIIAFGLSGVAISLGWQARSIGNVLVLVYVLLAAIYAVSAAGGLQQRIKFSVEPIGGSQRLLFLGLILVASGSLYLGCASDIQRNGFSVPESTIEMFAEQIEGQIITRVPAEQREVVLPQFREEFRRGVSDFFERTMKPYEQYIPLFVAAGFFVILMEVSGLLFWIPTLILGVLFSLLERLGLAKVVRETREVERLVIG